VSEPYYVDEYVTLFLGRMQDNDQWLDADVLITDPPYGMRYVSNSSKVSPTDPIIGDQDTTQRDIALAMWGDKKAALVFGTWRADRPRGTRQLLVWHKGDSPGMGDLTLPWGPSHEEIYVLGGRGGVGFTGKRGPSVIRSRVKEGSAPKDHDHPTPKPIYLMQTLIAKTTGTIADPFAGSGATAVAAKMLRRKCIAVELDRGYCDTIVQRLERIER
jgi:site-specific DNA-methyltransferase (adenine-specific)